MPGVASTSWRDVLFVNWPVPPATVRPWIPDQLELDTFDGDAYLAVVSLTMADTGPVGLPFGRTFPELNVRTYVRGGGRRAVYFFGIDLDDWLGAAVGGGLLGLPCRRADVTVEGGDAPGDPVEVRSRRRAGRRRSGRRENDAGTGRFAVRYAADGPFQTPSTDCVAGYLMERYRFYVSCRGGRLLSGDIHHEPWSLAPADAHLETNTLFEGWGLDRPASEPVFHVGAPIDVAVGRPRLAD